MNHRGKNIRRGLWKAPTIYITMVGGDHRMLKSDPRLLQGPAKGPIKHTFVPIADVQKIFKKFAA